MQNLVPFSIADLAKITNHRSGEVKFGEKMLTIPKGSNVVTYLQECDAKYVLFGIPEDIGIRANYGRVGASSAWSSAVQSIANIQHNKFCKGSNLLVLGHLDFDKEMTQSQDLDFNNTTERKLLNEFVTVIDKEVTHVVSTIIKAGKVPIIVGGGHNNAYGNIKGSALALGKPINVVNFDAHSDFRILEGRHSGNGFSYAFEEGFLKKYFIFGLHENYTSKNVLDILKKIEDKVGYNTYEEINIRNEKNFDSEMTTALNFIKTDAFGIEIDLDAIPNIASSAMTLSGFSVEELRRFISFFASNKNATYLHICEGAPALGEIKNNHLIGKLIGYLMTDFIKAKTNSLNKII